MLFRLCYLIGMSIADERGLESPTRKTAALAEGRDPGIEFQPDPRLFPRTFLLVESRRAFSGNESATCRYNVAHIFHRGNTVAV